MKNKKTRKIRKIIDCLTIFDCFLDGNIPTHRYFCHNWNTKCFEWFGWWCYGSKMRFCWFDKYLPEFRDDALLPILPSQACIFLHMSVFWIRTSQDCEPTLFVKVVSPELQCAQHGIRFFEFVSFDFMGFALFRTFDFEHASFVFVMPIYVYPRFLIKSRISCSKRFNLSRTLFISMGRVFWEGGWFQGKARRNIVCNNLRIALQSFSTQWENENAHEFFSLWAHRSRGNSVFLCKKTNFSNDDTPNFHENPSKKTLLWNCDLKRPFFFVSRWIVIRPLLLGRTQSMNIYRVVFAFSGVVEFSNRNRFATKADIRFWA